MTDKLDYVWIDFDDIDKESTTITLMNFLGKVNDDVYDKLFARQPFTAGDHEGNRVQAVLIDYDSEIINLRVFMDTFTPAEFVSDLEWEWE